MHIVQISTSDCIGGAALAAERLHRELNLRENIQSTMFVAIVQRPDGNAIEFNPSVLGPRFLGRILFRAGRRLQRRIRPDHRILFTQDWTTFGRLPNQQIPEADLYHLHWTADLLDFRMLPELARRAPIVWTFHDMNAFTGGCHYDNGCGRFAKDCGACPLIKSTKPVDVSTVVQKRKIHTMKKISDDGITVITPSRWLAEESRRSTIFSRFPTHVIPNGIDLTVFRPVNRLEARRRLGLTGEDRVILFVAEQIDNDRKGRRELDMTLTKIAHLPLLKVLTVGGGGKGMSGEMYRHLGHLNDPAAICDAYNAADLFVMPSLQDNLPNTVLESLACGTPVVGFATGGVPDAVEHGVNGLLAPTGDVESMAANILRVLLEPNLQSAFGRAARKSAENRYAVENLADAHLSLYRQLITNFRHQSSPRSLEANSFQMEKPDGSVAV